MNDTTEMQIHHTGEAGVKGIYVSEVHGEANKRTFDQHSPLPVTLSWAFNREKQANGFPSRNFHPSCLFSSRCVIWCVSLWTTSLNRVISASNTSPPIASQRRRSILQFASQHPSTWHHILHWLYLRPSLPSTVRPTGQANPR